VTRFLREARAAGNLNHVNIVQGIDAGKSPEGYYYFAMEYVEGQTLKAILQREHVIAESRAIDIITQIAQGLRHASRINLVHRDIKPENILITADGTAKLADLGLAKSSVEDASVTIAGQAMGTPLYISPEQAEGREDVDIRSDIYSLGATLYHITTGFPPFPGENPTVTMLKHINEEPPSPREVNPRLSEDLCHVILKMMAKAPSERYQTATELIDELSAMSAGQSPKLARDYARSVRLGQQVRVGTTARSSRVAGFAVAAVFVAGAALGAYFLFAGAGPTPPGSTGGNATGNTQQADQQRLLARLERDQKAFDQLREQVEELCKKGEFAAATEKIAAFRPPTRHKIVKKQAEDLLADVSSRRKQSDAEAFAAVSQEVAKLLEQDDHQGAIARVSRFGPASRHEDVRRQAEELLAKLNTEAYEALRARVKPLQERKDYQGAIALVTEFLEWELNRQTRARAEKQLDELRDERSAYVREQEGIGYRLIGEAKFDAARKIAEELKAQNSIKKADDLLAAVTKAEQERLERVRVVHERLWRALAERLWEQGIDAARACAEAELEDPANEVAAGEIKWDLALLDRLDQIDRDAHAGLKSLEGQEFPLHGKTPVLILKVTDTDYTRRLSGKPIRRRFSDLPPDDRLRLAQHHWQQTGTDATAAIAAYQLCVKGDLQAAAEAARNLPDAEKRRFDDRIRILAPEMEARAVVQQLLTAGSDLSWQEAVALCDKLQNEYAGTIAVRKLGAKLAELRRRAELRRYAAEIPPRFNGEVELLDDGQWRFHWDFSRLNHLGDFERVKPPPGFRTINPEIRGGMLMISGTGISLPVLFRGGPLKIEYKISLVTEASPAGYGGVIIHGIPRTRNNSWEFALCHGDARREQPDFFRNIYTIGRSANDCWQRDYPKGRCERRKWHTVRIAITENSARVTFDNALVYDNAAVRLPDATPDTAAVPPIAQPFSVLFTGWDPADTWAFDDVTVVGNIDPDWLKTKAAQPAD